MDINEYRKQLFLKSQYCTYYKVNNNTVLAGILRNNGYRYAVSLPEEKLKEVNQVYRRFTTLLNSVVAVELILYIYLVIFPYYLEFMNLPFFVVVMLLSLIPLVALYLTYIVINSLYENYLARYVGTFQRMKFQPKVKYIEEEAFQKYLKTQRKSVYILVLLILIFFSYVLTPLMINSLNNNKKFNSALRLANGYLTFMPVASNVYAQRAYAKFNLKQYKDAVEDYEKANKYSFSEDFNTDIVGGKYGCDRCDPAGLIDDIAVECKLLFDRSCRAVRHGIPVVSGGLKQRVKSGFISVVHHCLCVFKYIDISTQDTGNV